MASPELVDIRDTITRANNNIDKLKVFAPNRRLTNETGDLASLETRADGKTYDVYIGVAKPSTDLRMAIGDVLHGLRTALDHLSYALALKHGFPAIRNRTLDDLKNLRKLNFLIHEDEHRFKSAAGNVKKTIESLPVAEMEKLRPYKELDPRGPILWRLSELDNITKHRTIAAVEHHLKEAPLAITVGDQTITGTVTNAVGLPVTGRTLVASFAIDGLDFSPKVDVNIEPKVTIVFADTDGLCDGVSVFTVMRESVATVSTVVDDFEKLFF